MQEIGELAIRHGWESYVAYSRGRDGIKPCNSHLIPIGNKADVALHGLATRLFDRHGLASNRATRQFIYRIETIRPDIIHIHNLHGYFLNYRILFDYLAQSNLPVVWTVHDCWLYTGHCFYYSYAHCNRWQCGCGNCPQRHEFPASWLADRSRRNFLDKQAAFTTIPTDRLTIVPVSEWIKKEMQQSFFKGYDFHVIRNGIDTDVFKISRNDTVKNRYHITTRHILLGVASVWSREKGLDDFIRLSGMLNEDETIVLVGVKEETRKRLPRNILGIGRTGNIHQLAELYSASDAFVNPTWQDNYPTVNLEAMACGTPVITYHTGGSIEAVTGSTGFIVEQGDVNGILKAVRTIEHQGKEYYRETCRAYALSHFRKEERYADYLELYDRILGNSRNAIETEKT